MKTTIQINGLDVEFSDQKPTRPGAYWIKPENKRKPVIIHLSVCSLGFIICTRSGEGLDDIEGLWSAPLVPVTEVEKAHAEGFLGAHHTPGYSIKTAAIEAYEVSNARKVVEGEK